MFPSRTHARFVACVTLAALGLAPVVHAQSLTLNDGDSVTVSGAGTMGTIDGSPVANTTKSYSNHSIHGGVETNGTAVFNLGAGGSISAGQFGFGLYANGSGAVTITGGSITAGQGSYGLFASRNCNGTVTITGGSFKAGQYGSALYSFSYAPITIIGGSFKAGQYGNALIAIGGHITIMGGSFRAGAGSIGLDAYGSPNTITGGSFSAGVGGIGLDAEDKSFVTITGGSINAGSDGKGLYADGSSVTIRGGSITVGKGGTALVAKGSASIDLYGTFDGLTPGQTQTLPSDLDNGKTGSFMGTLANNTAWQTFTYLNYDTITLHARKRQVA